MLVEANRILPITRLQKELTQTVRELSDSGKPVYILKNNNMEAVLLSYHEYEYLKEIEEMFEQFEIKNLIEARLEKYNPKNNISWEKIREETWSVNIQFIPEAVKDYKSLDGNVRNLVNGKIDKLRENPFLGEALGNKNNIDLTSFYKIYVAKKTYIIVYRIIKNKIEIVEIWGIGKRNKMEIYKTIGKRISKRKWPSAAGR